jgi:hypothetical protein
MATKKTNKLPARQSPTNRSSESDYYIPPPPVLVNNNGQENKMGFLIGLIVMVFVFVIMLPVIGFMLMDINTVRQEVHYEVKKIEQLRKELEHEKDKK